MDDYSTAVKKQELFKKMNQGEVKVLIGSAKKMGTGLNVQNRLKVMHYLDPPWYPADVEQPEGRILRNGNQNETVRIYRYGTAKSYDANKWGLVADKSRNVELLLSGDPLLRVVEDISKTSTYALAQAIIQGDERAIRLAKVDSEVTRLRMLREEHYAKINKLRSRQNQLENYFDSIEERIAKYNEEMKTWEYVKEINGTVGKTSYDNRAAMGEALLDKIAKLFGKTRVKEDSSLKDILKGAEKLVREDVEIPWHDIGTINGYNMTARANRHNLEINIKSPRGLYIWSDFHNSQPFDEWFASQSPSGYITSITNAINSIPNKLKDEEKNLANDKREHANNAKSIMVPFPDESELRELTKELESLKESLMGEIDAETLRQARQYFQYRTGPTPATAIRKPLPMPQQKIKAGQQAAAKPFKNENTGYLV
jgi:hypothetical protein